MLNQAASRGFLAAARLSCIDYNGNTSAGLNIKKQEAKQSAFLQNTNDRQKDEQKELFQHIERTPECLIKIMCMCSSI